MIDHEKDESEEIVDGTSGGNIGTEKERKEFANFLDIKKRNPNIANASREEIDDALKTANKFRPAPISPISKN